MADLAIKRVVLVLGMHRSGTSALTRALNLLGFAIPKTLIKANSTNETGHWESRRVARLNDRILAEGELDWSSWECGALSQISASKRKEFVQDIIQTLKAEFEGHQDIVLKDPRICRLAPIYFQAFAAMNAEVHPVIIFRNPLEVATSLEKRNDIHAVDAIHLWLRYILDAEEATRKMERSFVHYDSFLDNWPLVMGKIQEHFGLDWPVSVEDAKPQIDAHINRGLKHNEYSSADTIHDVRTEGWAAEVFGALEVLQNNPKAEHPLKRLKQIKTDLDRANLALSSFSMFSEKRRAVLEGRLEQSRIKQTELQAKIDDQDNHIKDLTLTLDATTTSNEEKISEKSQELSALRTELDRMVTERNQTINRLEEDCGNKAQEIASLQNRASILVSELESKSRIADALNSELSFSRKELGKQSERNGDLLARLKAREKELRQLQRQHWRLKDELAWQKEMLSGFQSTTSWKITAPLRRLKRVLDKAKDNGGVRLESSLAPATPKPKSTEKTPSLEGRTSGGTKEKTINEQVRAIEASGRFDAAYYLANYPEAQTYPGTTIEHYVVDGWRKGFDPSANFVTNAWIASHPELKTGDICPLFDFVRSSRSENRATDLRESPPKIAVFGAVTDGYDDIKEPGVISDHADYFLFTDGEVPEYSKWIRRELEFVSHDPTRTARYIKTHPHLYFGDYDWAIWIDANLQLQCDPIELVASLPDGTQVATWHHPIRNCVYREASECLNRGKDDKLDIELLVKHLRAEKYPEQTGLYETSVFVSKMRDHKVSKFMNDWWTMIDMFSRRDQLALPPVLSKHNLQISTLAPSGVCMRTDPRFHYYRHSK